MPLPGKGATLVVDGGGRTSEVGMGSHQPRVPMAVPATAHDEARAAPGLATARPVPVGGLTVGRADDQAERAADVLAETALDRLRRLSGPGAVPLDTIRRDPAGRPADGVVRPGPAPSALDRRLRRWWRPMKETTAEKGIPSRSLPQPVHTAPPRGRKQVSGVRWEEVPEEPRQAYRFIDADDVGWEAPAHDKPFARTDWHKAAEKAVAAQAEAERAAATWWYDGRAKTWHKGVPPANHRQALADERPDLSEERDLHGHATPADVPVFVRARYRPTKGSKETKGRRPPGLRALDRTARLLMQEMPEEESPHLATATSGGAVLVAGNTGARFVSSASSARADTLLADALDPSEPLPANRRAAKDARKLRALQSGDYRAHHARFDQELKGISDALEQPLRWGNVNASGGSAEHGEMTVLGEVNRNLRANPNRGGQPIVKALGGVKLACGACALAFEAYNQHIAPGLGYVIKVSGTHGGFFDGWRVPDVIWKNKPALAHVRRGLPSGAYLNEQGVLLGVPNSDSSYHDPEESDSEWEEV